MSMEWAQAEFGNARLADRRQVTSVVRIAASLATVPGRSLSGACGDGLRQAAHRVMEHARTTVKGLLAGHFAATARRINDLPAGVPVLVASDTTAFVYKQNQIVGLAAVNDNPHVRGLYGHGCLAMTESGVPLGIVGLQFWGEEQLPPPGQGGTVSRRERFSHKWVVACRDVQRVIPKDRTVMLIQDREGDLYPLIGEPLRPGFHLIIRATNSRKVTPVAASPEAEGLAERKRLYDAAAAAPVVGQMRVAVPRSTAKGGAIVVPEREAQLTLRACEVDMQPPVDMRKTHQGRRMTVVEAREENPPAGVPPIHWILVTTLTVVTGTDAERVVVYYSRRWRIEQLHNVLKSGLQAEKLQVDDARSLGNTLCLYYALACRILHLTLATREQPDAPAATVFDADETTVLAVVAGKAVKTLGDAMQVIAKLGGYLKSSVMAPGAKTVWQGLRRLEGMVAYHRVLMEAGVALPSYDA